MNSPIGELLAKQRIREMHAEAVVAGRLREARRARRARRRGQTAATEGRNPYPQPDRHEVGESASDLSAKASSSSLDQASVPG